MCVHVVCVCVYMSIHACTCISSVVVHGGVESDWLRVRNKSAREEGELTSLTADCIRWDRYMYV